MGVEELLQHSETLLSIREEHPAASFSQLSTLLQEAGLEFHPLTIRAALIRLGDKSTTPASATELVAEHRQTITELFEEHNNIGTILRLLQEQHQVYTTRAMLTTALAALELMEQQSYGKQQRIAQKHGRKMLRWFDRGASLQTIVNHLAEQGETVCRTTVRKILIDKGRGEQLSKRSSRQQRN